ncbi:unnamed protein product [Lactuca saligna]|uniref:Uncharacterized protein n=1 Tax=Lactuca saligna TaxID=75948 RepID=A0AA36E534_LACSI|nr:unnamed protein product [Lactuca saligna]
MVGLRVPPADAAGQNGVEGPGIDHAETSAAASRAGQNGPQLRASRCSLRHLLPLVALRRHPHHHQILGIHLLGSIDLEEAKCRGRLYRMKNDPTWQDKFGGLSTGIYSGSGKSRPTARPMIVISPLMKISPEKRWRMESHLSKKKLEKLRGSARLMLRRKNSSQSVDLTGLETPEDTRRKDSVSNSPAGVNDVLGSLSAWVEGCETGNLHPKVSIRVTQKILVLLILGADAEWIVYTHDRIKLFVCEPMMLPFQLECEDFRVIISCICAKKFHCGFLVSSVTKSKKTTPTQFYEQIVYTIMHPKLFHGLFMVEFCRPDCATLKIGAIGFDLSICKGRIASLFSSFFFFRLPAALRDGPVTSFCGLGSIDDPWVRVRAAVLPIFKTYNIKNNFTNVIPHLTTLKSMQLSLDRTQKKKSKK